MPRHRSRHAAAAWAALILTVTAWARTSAQTPGTPRPVRTLLAVFAHPDDETIAGPLLAKYGADPRTRVVLAIPVRQRTTALVVPSP